MAEPSRGMGRGLAALLTPSTTSGGAGDRELRQLPVELIGPNPRQPRKELRRGRRCSRWPARSGTAACSSPCWCARRAGGTYELIAGERRWRAAQLAGLDTIPALVRAHDDAESLELALIENMAREDLNPVEEARACALLVEELGLTREEIGRRVGRSRVAVSNLLRLLDLPDEALDLLAQGDLTEGHGRAILMAAGPRRAPPARPRRASPRAGTSAAPRPRPARPPSADPVRRVRARRTGVHPDQEAAASQLGEAFGRALGADVKVTPRGTGYRVAMTFDSLEEALELAGRLGAVEPRLTPLSSPAAGRLAQSVRALL